MLFKANLGMTLNPTSLPVRSMMQEPDTTSSERRTVLVVEDETIVALDIQSQLEALGYTVLDSVGSGEEACDRVQQLEPDIVLMDIRLREGMDGVEAAALIRRTRDIPVIFLTAYADKATLERVKSVGPYGYIVKPFSRQDLHTSIEVALVKHRVDRLVRRSRQNLLAILDSQRQGTIALDRHGRITFASAAAVDFLGTDRSSLLGRPWKEAMGIDERARVALEGLVRTPARERGKVELEVSDEGGRRRLCEAEVLDDPREGQGQFVFLYDMSEVRDLRRMLDGQTRFESIVGKSPAIQQVTRLIVQLAEVDTSVLIEGETGTGKELVARAIHSRSHRKSRPFVAVNCAGLSEELAASQLFGHKRGAFTGAVSDHRGLFEAAHGGTLFLDEIGELPRGLQATFLRALEEKTVTPLGDTEPRPVDVRILAATNCDLAAAVHDGAFRADLFYRVRVARVMLPPLRERLEDLPHLAGAFLDQIRAATGKGVRWIDDAAMGDLLRYHWPGNIRELRNAIEFAVVHCQGAAITPADLPPEIWEGGTPAQGVRYAGRSEQERIRAALERTGNNRRAAAELLGISRATLYRRIAEYKLDER